MIELLLETGIRRRELLKLYTTDINQGFGMPVSASMTANMTQTTCGLKSLR
ncbi:MULTISPECIES: hypothetical protein [unclassified Pseudomonas]|uniref:hypothetical protein n=1 Tax=unclassified Pseudomonas TaxID=196821 RepID=UPI002114DEB3|nr:MULTISPECIES: hypothetical protein [unclassified Pseudomonas]